MVIESASAAAAAEAMNMNKHHDHFHTNDLKLEERSSIMESFRTMQNSAARYVPSAIHMDIFQWMEQRRQLAAAAAAAAAAHVAGAKTSGSDSEKPLT